MEAVLLNSSGGVAGGDVLATSIVLGEGTSATIATQSAERFYCALSDDPPAQVRNTVTLAAEAAISWLPQETILFDGCAMDRQLDVDMHSTARFLGVEALVFGRAAMGEVVASGRVSDLIRVRRDGHTLLHDATRLHGPIAEILARPAVAGPHRAVATLVYVAADCAGKTGRGAGAGCLGRGRGNRRVGVGWHAGCTHPRPRRALASGGGHRHTGAVARGQEPASRLALLREVFRPCC